MSNRIVPKMTKANVGKCYTRILSARFWWAHEVHRFNDGNRTYTNFYSLVNRGLRVNVARFIDVCNFYCPFTAVRCVRRAVITIDKNNFKFTTPKRHQRWNSFISAAETM